MTRRLFCTSLAATVLCSGQYLQQGLKDQYIAIVPLQGKGTAADPIRPMYINKPGPLKRGGKPTIEALSWSYTDNKQLALVRITGTDRTVLRAMQNDSRVKLFQRGRDKKDVVEREIRQHVKDFAVDDLPGLRKGQSK